MAIVRRIYVTEFKEVTVEIPQGRYEDLIRASDYEVLPPDPTIGRMDPIRQEFSTYPLDNWGFNLDGQEILPDNSKDTNGDGIPDYLSLDVNNDGNNDGFSNQDFVGVIKRTFLLGKIRYTDYISRNKTVQQIYESYQTGNIGDINTQFFEPGWVILAESKPSFYYEQCATSYGGQFYFGRSPVSVNYFDMDDIWVESNTDGSWNLVAGDLPGAAGIGIVGRVNLFTDTSLASRNGFDWNFGPPMEDMPAFMPIKFIQQYLPFVINEAGQTFFPNTNRNVTSVATIRTKVQPINLHQASRFSILPGLEELNESKFSDRPFRTDYYDLFTGIPERIEFPDGAKKRWGTPRHAIQRGFTVNGDKFSGTCIPIPGEIEDTTVTENSGKRTLVTIRDVLSGKVTLDGSNYIRGVVTAHFTYPIMSATMQDIADIYYAYYNDLTAPRAERVNRQTTFWEDALQFVVDATSVAAAVLITAVSISTGTFLFALPAYPALYGFSRKIVRDLLFPPEYTNHPSPHHHLLSNEFSPKKDKNFHTSDFLTFGREMRSVVYVQDETAGMELLGTDFYSSEGLEFKTAPGSFGLPGSMYATSVKKFKSVIKNEDLKKEFDSQLKLITKATAAESDVFTTDEIVAASLSGASSGGSTIKSKQIPIKQYWESDTGYLPERYHFKVGDFIEIYNLNILKRLYAPRTCKIVNNEYKIIPNEVEDVNKFFEDNGYIKDVTIKQLYLINENNPMFSLSGTDQYKENVKWYDYDYSDENSVHNTEHCLIRVKNVAFFMADRDYVGSQLLDKTAQLFAYRNDFPPIASKTNPAEYDDFGYRFEPGRKYVIGDATNIGSSGKIEQNVDGNKIWLYNAMSTEMSLNLLKIPGKNTRESLSKDYTDWLSKKRKLDPDGLQYKDYKWPLDIVGIQKHSYPNDSTSDWRYMIMPRSMEDFGITAENYDILRGQEPFPATGSKTSGGRSNQTGGGSNPTDTRGGSSSNDRRPTCFKKGTGVLTSNGYVSIETLKVGDKVITFDMDLNLYERSITRTYKHDGNEKSDIYTYRFSNGTVLNVTENHPFLNEQKEFVNIGDLKIGDSVLNKDGESVYILEKQFLENDTVYNIEVEEYNAYIAEEICVHNLTKVAPNLNDIIVEDGPGLI